jgi:hypothetical protein
MALLPLCYRFAVALLSLCYRLATALLSLCYRNDSLRYRLDVVVQSPCARFEVDLRLLCKCFAITIQSKIVLHSD